MRVAGSGRRWEPCPSAGARCFCCMTCADSPRRRWRLSSRSARKRPARCSSAPARSSDKAFDERSADARAGTMSAGGASRGRCGRARTRRRRAPPAGPACGLLQALPRGDEDLGRWAGGPRGASRAAAAAAGARHSAGLRRDRRARRRDAGRGRERVRPRDSDPWRGTCAAGLPPTRSPWLAWRSPGGWLSTKGARGPSSSRRALGRRSGSWSSRPRPVCRGSTQVPIEVAAPLAGRLSGRLRQCWCRARPSKWLRSLRVGPPPAKARRPALERAAQTRRRTRDLTTGPPRRRPRRARGADRAGLLEALPVQYGHRQYATGRTAQTTPGGRQAPGRADRHGTAPGQGLPARRRRAQRPPWPAGPVCGTDKTIVPRRRTPRTAAAVTPGRIPPDPRREPRTTHGSGGHQGRKHAKKNH